MDFSDFYMTMKREFKKRQVRCFVFLLFWPFIDHPPSKKDRDRLRGEYNRYRDCKQRLYVIDGFLERPQTSLDSLIVDAQSVGRAHKRKKVVDLNSNSASNILQRSPGNVPILQTQDSTPCT